ncbi:MAG: FtsX-like permease family protein [Bacteroidetes bacterium]|nr:FtsX-like permease family protein [Bacteroidota bacterium]
MFQTNLKFILRNLWRNRLFTSLHVAGLAIGLSAAWLMWQYMDFENSFDRTIPNGENIYRVVSFFKGLDNEENTNAGCPQPLWRTAEEVAGVEKAVPIHSTFAFMAWPEGAKTGFKEVRDMAKTTPEYFDLVPLKWLAGSAAKALTQPNEVVLTRSRAERYFPRHTPEEVLGKTMKYVTFNDTTQAKVVGVVEDADAPSSFIEKEMLSIGEAKADRWAGVSSNEQVWLVLRKDADLAAIEQSINKISEEKGGAQLKQWNMSRRHELQALGKVHFANNFGSNIPTADAKVLKVLGAIALFLLLLACINYINLSTAQIPTRAREIGIRKTLGGQRKGIVGSFLVETVVICAIATLLAAGLTHYAFTFFKDDLPEDILKYADWRKTAAFLAGMVAVVSILAGIYPGWLASRSRAASLLRGDFAGQSQGRAGSGNLRRGLIVFQFFVAQAFIIGALVVGQQLHFMRTSDLGFDRQAVLTVEQPFSAYRDTALAGKLPILAQTLRQMPEIQQVAIGDAPLTNNFSSDANTYLDDNGIKHDVELYRKNVDEHLPELYRFPLVAGRFLTASDSSNRYVINKMAAKAFGFESPQAAVGKFIGENAGEGKPNEPREIVGVVGDFHSASFSEGLKPLALIHEPANASTLNVRLASSRPADWQPVINKMKAEWQKLYPDEVFEPKFYDEMLANIYEADLTMAKFINLATTIAIFISCLGLFGLATFMANRRTKEIGVRKVLGASISSVVGLLSREFIVLVLVGFLLATPLAFYFLKKWLEEYAFRIELSWWMFAVAGLAAVLIAFITVSFQSIKAALANPVKSLRSE